MTTSIAVPEKQEIEQKLQPLSERALTLKVIDDATLLIADTVQTECRKMRQFIEAKYKKLKDPVSAALDNIRIEEKTDLARVVRLEDHVKKERTDFQLAQKKIREAEESRLLKLAREREEAERLERAIEIEKEAAALKASGQVEEAAAVQKEAEQILATPSYVPPPKMAAPIKTKNKIKMIVDRERLQTIADSLNNHTLGSVPNIPGVRFYQQWQVEVFAASNVPEEYRKAS